MTVAELLETVRRVEVRTNRLVNDTMVGAYLSHFKGRGMDFEELREYIPGDEVRDIDWNVTFRMGRPFVKRFREERELALVLAVDVSASSAFGSLRRTKREFAAEIAGTLAILPATAQGPPAHPAIDSRDAVLRAEAYRNPHPGGAGFPESRAAPPLDCLPAHRFSPQLFPRSGPALPSDGRGVRGEGRIREAEPAWLWPRHRPGNWPDQRAPRPGLPAPARSARECPAAGGPPDHRGRRNG
ncbi:MAG: hypothetical protein DME25_15910 [Verrucomicrobia bacterium]|nr:MAG: hypothetical protein DME25_15910 [Verrucomicrobiota bacterium]